MVLWCLAAFQMKYIDFVLELSFLVFVCHACAGVRVCVCVACEVVCVLLGFDCCSRSIR